MPESLLAPARLEVSLGPEAAPEVYRTLTIKAPESARALRGAHAHNQPGAPRDESAHRAYADNILTILRAVRKIGGDFTEDTQGGEYVRSIIALLDERNGLSDRDDTGANERRNEIWTLLHTCLTPLVNYAGTVPDDIVAHPQDPSLPAEPTPTPQEQQEPDPDPDSVQPQSQYQPQSETTWPLPSGADTHARIDSSRASLVSWEQLVSHETPPEEAHIALLSYVRGRVEFPVAVSQSHDTMLREEIGQIQRAIDYAMRQGLLPTVIPDADIRTVRRNIIKCFSQTGFASYERVVARLLGMDLGMRELADVAIRAVNTRKLSRARNQPVTVEEYQEIAHEVCAPLKHRRAIINNPRTHAWIAAAANIPLEYVENAISTQGTPHQAREVRAKILSGSLSDEKTQKTALESVAMSSKERDALMRVVKKGISGEEQISSEEKGLSEAQRNRLEQRLVSRQINSVFMFEDIIDPMGWECSEASEVTRKQCEEIAKILQEKTLVLYDADGKQVKTGEESVALQAIIRKQSIARRALEAQAITQDLGEQRRLAALIDVPLSVLQRVASRPEILLVRPLLSLLKAQQQTYPDDIALSHVPIRVTERAKNLHRERTAWHQAVKRYNAQRMIGQKKIDPSWFLAHLHNVDRRRVGGEFVPDEFVLKRDHLQRLYTGRHERHMPAPLRIVDILTDRPYQLDPLDTLMVSMQQADFIDMTPGNMHAESALAHLGMARLYNLMNGGKKEKNSRYTSEQQRALDDQLRGLLPNDPELSREALNRAVAMSIPPGGIRYIPIGGGLGWIVPREEILRKLKKCDDTTLKLIALGILNQQSDASMSLRLVDEQVVMMACDGKRGEFSLSEHPILRYAEQCHVLQSQLYAIHYILTTPSGLSPESPQYRALLHYANTMCAFMYGDLGLQLRNQTQLANQYTALSLPNSPEGRPYVSTIDDLLRQAERVFETYQQAMEIAHLSRLAEFGRGPTLPELRSAGRRHRERVRRGLYAQSLLQPKRKPPPLCVIKDPVDTLSARYGLPLYGDELHARLDAPRMDPARRDLILYGFRMLASNPVFAEAMRPWTTPSSQIVSL